MYHISKLKDFKAPQYDIDQMISYNEHFLLSVISFTSFISNHPHTVASLNEM